MAKPAKGGLGRGLNSLLSGSVEEASPREREVSQKVKDISVSEGTSLNRNPSRQTITQESSPLKSTTQTQKAQEEKDKSSSLEQEEKRKQESSAKNSDDAKKKAKSFLEEDDHVIIKEVKERRVDEVALNLIQPNPDQPRTSFRQEEIEELSASIEKDGLLQPILVRSVGKNYQIIAGERRWQACKALGMKTVPVRIREADDDKALELALVENIQRSDLNPIEEAYGYRRLMERRGFTQSEVAEAVSKGRSTIANALRLLELPEDAQQLLFEEKITAGHARAILSVPSKEGRQKLTERLVKEKMSVRETEAIARLFAGTQKKGSISVRPPTPASFKTVARALRETLHTNVRVKTAQGKNKIEIEFKDEEELERLYDAISSSQE